MRRRPSRFKNNTKSSSGSSGGNNPEPAKPKYVGNQKGKDENNAEYANRLISQATGKTNYTKPSGKLYVSDMAKYRKGSGTTIKPVKSGGRFHTMGQQPTSQLKPETMARYGIGANPEPKSSPATINATFPFFHPGQNNQAGTLVNADGSQMTAKQEAAQLSPTQIAAALGVSSMQAIIGSATNIYNLNKLNSQIMQSANTNTVTNNVVNSKNVKIVNNIIGKGLAAKGISMTGIAATLAGAAGTMFFGQWAQAEGGEALNIIMRDTAFQARQTGDWSLYDEAANVRNEILDLDMWEKAALWTPFSVFVGIPNKLKGVKAAGQVMDKLAQSNQQAQETGETPQQQTEREESTFMEERRLSDENHYMQALEYDRLSNAAYLETQAASNEMWLETQDINRARKSNNEISLMKQQAAFWAKQAELERQKAEEDRIAMAEFWLAFNKEKQKQADDSRPSNLNFGLF